MNAGGRLALYALGLVVAIGGAGGIAKAVVPEGAVANWKKDSTMTEHIDTPNTASEGSAAIHAESLAGLSLSAQGYTLSPVSAPREVGEEGELSFRIEDAAGAPVLAFTPAHERALHIMIVRSDGTNFRHVHPTLEESSGTWSLPWEWTAAGSYRVFVDVTPTGAQARPMTLTRTVEVAGTVDPVASAPSRISEVAGFTLTLDGDLAATGSSELTVTVARAGVPVTALEPYLGAYGHLVALREGDLAFLHVHADGDAPAAGETSGPQISFTAHAPSDGRYLLYLDFQVAGEVHTAEFVLDAVAAQPGH